MGELAGEVNKPDIFENFEEKEDCQIRIVGGVAHNWKPKEATSITKETIGMKVEILITDKTIRCENKDAKPTRKLNDYINLQKHPYIDKESGELVYSRPNKAYQLERAFGFEPLYVNADGEKVEPKISKTGRKYCPKDASQKFNPDFLEAYFDEEGKPRFNAWLDRNILADVGVQESENEEYGPRNVIKSYKPAVE